MGRTPGPESPPAYSLRFEPDGSFKLDGVQGRGTPQARAFRLELEGISRIFAAHLEPPALDLVDVAMAAYAADRVCRRAPRGAPRRMYDHRWVRRLELTVPVRVPDLWRDGDAGRQLEGFLGWLTEDHWHFRFVGRPREDGSAPWELLSLAPSDPEIALFSGGLDSFAGLCNRASRSGGRTFVLVAGATNGRLRGLQRRLLERLKEARPGWSLVHLPIPMGLSLGSRSYDDEERTQRTRGFVHGVLGTTVALALGAEAAFCYENGVGALNLPVTPAQLGTQGGRSAHPLALARLADLVERVVGKRVRVELPYLFQTKGEMCGAVPADLRRIAEEETVSCDGFPQRQSRWTHCGKCTSCVLRHLALSASGGLDLTRTYRVRLDQLAVEELPYEFKAMLLQARRMRGALKGGDPWADLVRAYPDLEAAVLRLESHGWDPDELRTGVTRLFTRYLQEWDLLRDRPLLLPLT